jgi:outer membrane immunogenic protein
MGGSMKKLLLATASLVVLAGSAMAADLPVYKAAPIVAAPACANFGGFYVGGNVGWKYYEHKWKDKDNYGAGFLLDTDGSESDNSWTAGVQTGYNWQFHCAVWGIQADWNWTNADASSDYSNNAFLPFFGSNLNVSSTEKWYGTLRTRSGLVVDNLLLYVTGGLAWARFDRDLTYTATSPLFGFAATQSYDASRTRLGFAVGAGTEWALSQNWSINSEFLYMAFEKDDTSFACSTAATCGFFPVGAPFRYEFKDSEWVAKIGVNYRFSGYAPVVAKY